MPQRSLTLCRRRLNSHKSADRGTVIAIADAGASTPAAS
jgi:hypothetical protein